MKIKMTAEKIVKYIALCFLMSALPTRGEEMEVQVERNVEYATVDGKILHMDLYQPRDSVEQPPLVVWIHGGAWRSGSKESVPVKHWLSHGVMIASVNYRLSGEAKFPAQIHDIKAAIRYLRARATRFGFNTGKIIAAGSSAGGHLAALVGVSNGVSALEGEIGNDLQASSDVNAAISFYGASNLNSILSQSTQHGLSVRVPALQLLLGGQPNQVTELATLASPISHVDLSDPPLWLIHGNADPQMPMEQSLELNAAYQKKGLQVHLDTIKGGQHGGPEFYSNKRLSRLADAIKQLDSQSR